MSYINQLIAIFFSACLPIIEVKGAIPMGLAVGLPLIEVFLVAFIGSCLPIPFIIIFVKKILKWMKSTKAFKAISVWIENKVIKKADKINRSYREWALFIFVAIPLPGTGIWTGSAIAAFLDLRVKQAIVPIVLGNLVASTIITFLSYVIIY